MLRWISIVLLAMTSTAQAESDVDKGRSLATRLCAVCHLNEGQGAKQGAAGIPGFFAIARRPGMTQEAIVTWLKSAPPMMPNHHLTTDEAYALAAFIESLGTPKSPSPKAP